MSGAAAAAAQDPSRELKTPQDRQGWFKLEPEKFTELCSNAYVDGDYGYVLRECSTDGESRSHEGVHREDHSLWGQSSYK